MNNQDTEAAAVTIPNLVFGNDGTISADTAIIHDNETFRVQWSAFNQGTTDASAFTDSLVITQLPEGCPPSSDEDHPVVFDSQNADNPDDFSDGPISSGENGRVMQPLVGPFPRGSYQLTVTLATGLANVTNSSCIDIIPSY